MLLCAHVAYWLHVLIIFDDDHNEYRWTADWTLYVDDVDYVDYLFLVVGLFMYVGSSHSWSWWW